jgi:hypothetical protein
MDVALPNEAQSAKNDVLFLDEKRIEVAKNEVEIQKMKLDSFITTLELLPANTEANRAQILAEIDQHCQEYIELLSELAAYGLPQTGIGFIYDRKKLLYKAIMEKIAGLILRWEAKLAEFEALLTEYDNLPPATTDEERFKLLLFAERKIYTQISTAIDPSAFRLELDVKKANFEAKLKEFTDLQDVNHPKLSDLLQATSATLPITDFDVQEFEVTAQEDQIVVFVEELASHTQSLKAELEKRLDKVQSFFDEAVPLSAGKKRVDLLQEAGKQLFGADFKMLPEFESPAEQAGEWANSYNNSEKLLEHLISTEKMDFPMDEWLYGLARVREKARAWENTIQLCEAFTGNSPELHPVQLPYDEEDFWMALSFHEKQNLSQDKLLYTAHYATAFDKTRRQCGLLLDEWTELIPSKTEDVGVSFHYDRPNSEPPQVMLLAMPTEFTGNWKWEDLIKTVNDTLDQAKKRAVEPEHIDKTSYARFLPATVSPVTVHPISASLNYSFNNLVYQTLNTDSDE